MLDHGCHEDYNSASTDNRTTIVKPVVDCFALRNKRKRKGEEMPKEKPSSFVCASLYTDQNQFANLISQLKLRISHKLFAIFVFGIQYIAMCSDRPVFTYCATLISS